MAASLSLPSATAGGMPDKMNPRTGTAEDDLLLIGLVASGDRSALEKLYANHHRKVFHFVRRFVHEAATAEDLANDVFIEVWHKAGSFEGRSSVSSWLLGMARFKALTERRKTRNTVDPDEALGGIQDDADDPEVAAQKSNKSAALRLCIERLPEEHRVVVDLVYYHERPIREVAEILDVPENTVKTRMFHARKKLSAMMEQAGLDRGWP